MKVRFRAGVVTALHLSLLMIMAQAEGGPISDARLGEADVPRLIADLCHDDRRWNAEDALDALREIGEPAVPALRAALDSKDHQQRHCACVLLSEINSGPPTSRQIDVLIEALRTDTIPDGSDGKTLRVANARNACETLERWPDLGADALAAALASDDWQQRFLAAYLVGRRKDTRHAELVCTVLIPHLRSNNIELDALFAGAGLYAMGEAARPYLVAALHTTDGQQGRLITAIIRDIDDPTTDPHELERRARAFDVRRDYGMTNCWVPHVEFSIESLMHYMCFQTRGP
jgi:hypothetical protein